MFSEKYGVEAFAEKPPRGNEIYIKPSNSRIFAFYCHIADGVAAAAGLSLAKPTQFLKPIHNLVNPRRNNETSFG